MKSKLLLSLFLGASIVASADGYKDGIEYFKADQFDNAKDILERNLNNSDTDKAISYYYLGAIDLKKGDKTAAKANFDKGVAANSNCAFNYVGLGQLALLNNNIKSAEEYFKKASSLAKKNSEITVLIARAYYNADPVKYAKEVEKNLNKARKDSKLQEPSIYIFEGDMLMDQNQIGDAAGKYENAIYYQNDNSEGYVKYANAYANVNKNFAIQKLEELVALQPNSALAQRELAEKYYENDQWRKASDAYGKYIQNPNHFPEDRQRYAVLLYYGESYQPSLEIAESYLTSDADNFLMNRMKMLNLTALKRYPEAKQAAEKFFTLKGYFTGNDYLTYSEILNALGDPEGGVAIIEKGTVDLPDNLDLLRSLSMTYYNAKQFDAAANTYSRFIDKKAATEEGVKDTELFEAAGRYLTCAAATADSLQAATAANKGLEFVNKGLEQQPNNPSFVRRKAQLIMLGNGKNMNDASANEFLRLVDLLDKNPDGKNAASPNNDISYYKNAYQMLGIYYIDKEDIQNALKYFKLYLELDPTNEGIREFVEKNSK